MTETQEEKTKKIEKICTFQEYLDLADHVVKKYWAKHAVQIVFNKLN